MPTPADQGSATGAGGILYGNGAFGTLSANNVYLLLHFSAWVTGVLLHGYKRGVEMVDQTIYHEI